MLNILRRSSAERAAAERLLASIISRSRDPYFFEQLSVPDTLDGRFDLAALHAWIALERLGQLGRRSMAQRLTDALFTSFDEGLRELGAGDMGMGRRMKQIANAFYGRMAAYRGAAGGAQLAESLQRNVYRGASGRSNEASLLARYVETAIATVAANDLQEGALDFGPLPRE